MLQNKTTIWTSNYFCAKLLSNWPIMGS